MTAMGKQREARQHWAAKLILSKSNVMTVSRALELALFMDAKLDMSKVRCSPAFSQAQRFRDAAESTQPELRTPGATAQTRMVSVAGIRLDPPRSMRCFKGIICDGVSECESYMPSQAVRSPCARCGVRRSTACPSL
jgi:hypothetical protein